MSHITSCEIDHEHHVVDFVSHTWQINHFNEARERNEAIVFKDAPWPCRGGGIAASPLFQQADVGKIPATVKH